MRILKQIVFLSTLAFTMLTINGCKEKNVIIDQNIAVENFSWLYANNIKFDVKIDDEKQPYNIYMNLRVTADYKYSNLFVLIKQSGPDKKVFTKRYELTLASKNGEWLGAGTGNLYHYQLRFLTNHKFLAKGVYHFFIEQNMRDNPLKEVSDVGLKVEKAL